ncbi:hypothetical protein ANN_10712 [Periplaneta americana]|uniref:Uncharacterized protein n=1 Tax=Periplaneta americana TaxID=6978 RepID=A0ABQ8T5B3_PERAM|nr:hypothetical protein ANN_10712 [Periplaneta americana]
MVVEKRKQANLKFLQDPVEANRDNYFNERREASRTLRNKKGHYLKEKLDEVETNSMNKNIRDLYEGIKEFKNEYYTRYNSCWKRIEAWEWFIQSRWGGAGVKEGVRLELSPPTSEEQGGGKDKSDRGLVRVEFKTLDDKIAVMRNKNKLKGEDCYIDADLTKQEREIQQALRTRAREERGKGNIVKFSYQKLLINDKWVNW